jgi:peptidoglycan/xylan/chitin deacetylase (PgdA/CDA1 family)
MLYPDNCLETIGLIAYIRRGHTWITRMHNETTSLPVVKVAALCTCVALVLFLVDSRLCALPLSFFVVCCLVAPFFPRLGFFLPVISQGCTGKNMVALTFDDGPEPATTPNLLALLEKYNAKATFFVIDEKVDTDPELLQEIIAQGHAVGNHSYHHDVLLMLRSSKTIEAEITAAQDLLGAAGIKPLIFRPPVGVTNPKLGRVLEHQGLSCVNFSCRGVDFGNRRIKGLAGRILRKVRPDDIILLHDRKPHGSASVEMWLQEIEELLAGLAAKNLVPVPLEQLLGRDVCRILK